MQQRSKILLGTAAGLAIALTIYILATAPAPSDQQQIADGIETARAGIEHRNALAVLTTVSADYKDTTFANVDQLHYILNRVLHDAGHLSVATTPATINVTGNTAQSVSRVTIMSADNLTNLFDGTVTLHWRRERAHRYLIFPSSVWRVTGGEYPGMPSLGDGP